MTYVIVGASAGVGRALATRFAAAGHDLVLVASDERDLRATAADLAIRHGVRTRCVAADAARDPRCAERITAAAVELGGLDGALFPIGAVSPADDLVVAYLQVPLRDVQRLDLLVDDAASGARWRVEDVAFDPAAQEVVLASSMIELRRLPVALRQARGAASDFAQVVGDQFRLWSSSRARR